MVENITTKDFYFLYKNMDLSWFTNELSDNKFVKRNERYSFNNYEADITIHQNPKPASGLSQAYTLPVNILAINLTGEYNGKNIIYHIFLEVPEQLGDKRGLWEKGFYILNKYLMKNGYGCLCKEVEPKLFWLKEKTIPCQY